MIDQGKKMFDRLNPNIAHTPKVVGPVQEPVGTLNISRYKGHLVNHDFDYFGELPDGIYSVYTTPPKREWVGLTENKIEAIEEKALTKQWAIRMALTALKEENFD